MSLEDLEKRVQVLEDIEDIKRLKRRYCLYCDDNYDADALAELFVENAVWDGGIRGKNEGREAIRTFFQKAPQRLPFAIHMVTNPIIEVDGDIAAGQWLLFQPCTDRGIDGAVWLAATYYDQYRRVDGRWLIHHTKIDVAFFTPFDKGWTVERFLPGRAPIN